MFRQITLSIICLTVIFSAGCRNLYTNSDRRLDSTTGFHGEKIVEDAAALLAPAPTAEPPEETEAKRQVVVRRIITRASFITESAGARGQRHGVAHVRMPDDFEGQMKESYKVLGAYEHETRMWSLVIGAFRKAATGIVSWITGNPVFSTAITGLFGLAIVWIRERRARAQAERERREQEEARKRAEEDALHVVDNLRRASRRGEALEDEKGEGTPALAKATARLRPAFDRRRNGAVS